MMYRLPKHIQRFADRLVSEQEARDYVAAERLHVEAVRKAIDATVDEFYPELKNDDE